MSNPAPRVNYRLGSLYSIITAFLLATQEPFSFLAAKRLNSMQFVCLTQIALLISIPLLTLHATSRRDFVALLRDASNYGKLAVIFAIGMSGLLLYNLGLSNAHPIIISAILNLSPFWAALVALLISRVPIPVSPAIFFFCLAGAFIGAMAVAWSQLGGAGKPTIGELADNVLHGTWVYAIPIPVFSALGGTLIGKWFAKYDESAAIAANFLVSTRRPDTGDRCYPVPALGAAIRSIAGDRSDDRRHDRRRIGRSRFLSGRLDRHRQRQWLRHDVFSAGPSAYRFGIAAVIVVDRRPAFRCRAHVLFRPDHNRRVFAFILAKILAITPARQRGGLAGAPGREFVRTMARAGRFQLARIAPGPGVAPGGHLPRMIMPSTSSLVTSVVFAIPTT